MFCCMSIPVVEDDKPLVVDLNKMLIEKAWINYQAQFNICQKRWLKREKFIIEVPENFFVFDQVEQTINPRKRFEIKSSGSSIATDSSAMAKGKDGANNNMGLLKGKVPSTRDLTNPEVVSVDTKFSNDTAERQMYKFRFEKTRRTEINVSFQKGFTFGGKANFSLSLPVVDVGAGVEMEMQYQVTKSEGQTFEESMVMEATSDVAVGPNSCYTARIQLEERTLHADFKVVTRMTMPQGRAPVYIKRKSDGEQVFVYNVKNLVDIFADGNDAPAKVVKNEEGRVRVDCVDFVVEGVLKGMLACNHEILLTSNESDELKTMAQQRFIKSVREDD